MANKIDKKAFEFMEAEADKTDVNLFEFPNASTKNIHNLLSVAGFVPGLGNIADAADALLYASEGEFSDAAISMASMIPLAGQMVSAKKLLKVARKTKGGTIKVYRGYGEWYPGEMVKGGKFVPSGTPHSTRMGKGGLEKHFSTTTSKVDAEEYARKWRNRYGTKDSKPVVLEFELPKEWLDETSDLVSNFKFKEGDAHIVFKEGLVKNFLTKVHKYD
jgi:hypothetical protein